MKHEDIWTAISAVRADLAVAGIGKDQFNQQQRFAFRGIDDMYNAISAVLAKHGVVPRVAEVRILGDGHSVRPTKNGSVYHMAVLATVSFEIGAGGGQRMNHEVLAEAADSGDKVASKVMSMIMKYAFLTLFTIPTQGASDDADGDSQAPRPGEDIVGDAKEKNLEWQKRNASVRERSLRMTGEDFPADETPKTRPGPAPEAPKPWPSGLTASEAPEPDAPGFARIILASLQEAETLDVVMQIAEHIPDSLIRSMKPAVREARERVGA